MADACFDVQSKGIKNIQPTQLGEYLVTLFKNYISEFNFEGYLLFVEGVSATISSQLNGKIYLAVLIWMLILFLRLRMD